MQYAALITWIVTAALGAYMLATWVAQGGTRSGAGAASHFRPPVVFGHFLLAAAGLVVWLIYLVNDSTALAWIAFVDLLVVAVIGDTLVLRWYKDRKADAGAGGASGGRRAGTGGQATGDTMTDPATGRGVGLAEQRIPAAAVAAHGVFAVATVVLVLLAALQVGA
jgi:manganese efflux pump family protein